MKKNFLFRLLLAVCLPVAFTACSDDDQPAIDNVTTLNMLDVNNGATRLGNSDIVINEANNFQTRNCLIAELGRSKGIGKIVPPQVGDGLVRQAAVLPGTRYQAFPEAALKQFPSGETALSLEGDYYQFYVESEIIGEEEPIGAVIRFSLLKPEDNGLPAYGSTIGTVDFYNEFTYVFPKGTEIVLDGNDTYNQVSIEDNRLTIKFRYDDGRDAYTFYVRNGKVYTKADVKVIRN